MKHIDQLHREIIITSTPKRIVSLVPSQTELLVDLGLESLIIGVTKFCIHPKSLRSKTTIVGGTKAVHLDKIKALKPDIILCNKEENTEEMVLQLEKIAPVHVSDIYTIQDSLDLIDMYGELFSKTTEASALILELQFKFKEFKNWINNKPRLKVAYFIWKDPWMVAGHSTFINDMLQINNFDNYFIDFSRYPEIELDKIDSSIDVLLFSSEPFPFNETHLHDIYVRFPKSKVKIVNGEYFSWYGSRLREAFAYFKSLRQTMI